MKAIRGDNMMKWSRSINYSLQYSWATWRYLKYNFATGAVLIIECIKWYYFDYCHLVDRFYSLYGVEYWGNILARYQAAISLKKMLIILSKNAAIGSARDALRHNGIGRHIRINKPRISDSTSRWYRYTSLLSYFLKWLQHVERYLSDYAISSHWRVPTMQPRRMHIWEIFTCFH